MFLLIGVRFRAYLFAVVLPRNQYRTPIWQGWVCTLPQSTPNPRHFKLRSSSSRSREENSLCQTLSSFITHKLLYHHLNVEHDPAVYQQRTTLCCFHETKSAEGIHVIKLCETPYRSTARLCKVLVQAAISSTIHQPAPYCVVICPQIRKCWNSSDLIAA